MGKKPKCTVEEKISAVEDYLNGIRSVSEIMVDLSIKSTRTIRDWILAYQNGGIKALCPVTANHSYSSEFKIEMVRKYINGEGSVTDLCARYGIPAHATLQKWISLYNANRELKDYIPKREVYMAEARRKTTSAKVGTAFGNIVVTIDGVKPVFRIKAGEQFKTLGMHFANRAHGAVFPKFIAVTQFNISKAVGKVVF